MVIIEVSKLKEYEFNKDFFDDLNKGDYNALKKDIEKNGIKTELHVLPDYTVICGHQRLLVAKELGLKEVPVKIVNGLGSVEQVKEYVIKDNLLRRQLSTEQRYVLLDALSKLYETGRGIYGVGRPKLEDAKVASPYDVNEKTAQETGATARTVARAREYVKIITQTPELKTTKATIALKKYKKEKQQQEVKEAIEGKEYQNLIQGDAITKLKEIQTQSIDCVITDPPYGIDFKSVRGNNTNDFNTDQEDYAIKLFEQVAPELNRITKNNSHIYIFCGFQTVDKFKQILEQHFELRNILIWVKNNHTPTNYDYNYAHKYEMILFTTKGKRPLNNKLSPDVLEFDNDIGKLHSAQKPIPLLEYLINNSTFEKEVVLDCFAGSGSTLIAAQKLKRNWIGIELEQEFIGITKKRLEELK
jgi:site-specific DNA-methyltransferase (adenine-specific)